MVKKLVLCAAMGATCAFGSVSYSQQADPITAIRTDREIFELIARSQRGSYEALSDQFEGGGQGSSLMKIHF